MDTKAAPISRPGLLNLLVVYLVWSSTYLAIRVAVAGSNGFNVLSAGYIRMLLAGILLILFCVIRKYPIRITLQELAVFGLSGCFLWVGGNGLIMWAEKQADSGFAALVVSSTPLIVAGIESVLNKKAPSKILTFSLLLAFIGLWILLGPAWRGLGGNSLMPAIALLAGTVSWSVGTVYQARQNLDLPAPVAAAYQHLSAGILFLMLSIARGQYIPDAGPNEWLALLYLVVFGSVLAFTAYVKTLQLLPINLAMTYAFVNPVLALFLGWAILNEQINLFTLLGALVVILGVVGVFWERVAIQRPGTSKTTDIS
ncbi:MAG: EamA family transporter [Syntrophomonas sp.]